MKDRDLKPNDGGPEPPSEEPLGDGLSRRRFLERGGIVVVGTAGLGTLAACGSGSTKTTTDTATAAETAAGPATTSSAVVAASGPVGGVDATALTALSSAQARTLDAALSRLIPKDDNGPGASEAMVWRYIDRSLGGELSMLLPLYTDGLAELDEAAVKAGKASFADLDAAKQDELLKSLSSSGLAELDQAAVKKGGKAKSLSSSKKGDGAAFFATLHEHALQGMFGDPFHGGNAGFAGWDLLGYPGIKGSWSAKEQAVGTVVKPVHKSTYEMSSIGFQNQGA